MDKDKNKNSQEDDKTVVSEVGANLPRSESGPNEPSSKLSTSLQKALTQIDVSFQKNDTNQGFLDAKLNADKALADNEIILNNRFVLKETLGSGGMGTVYKAQDLRKVEARDNHPFVAAKILNSDFKNHPDAFISLQREASRSHLLSHPNIVTVHDFDRDGNTIFMTMELLEGEDLESLIARHKNQGLAKEEALSIFKDFCIALDFAHQKGIIHSDFKPGNIFVTKDEGTKVLDFGIARLALESKRKDHFDAGRIGAITPAYASLEMIGHKEPDPRDDVFAAALIGYELLTGKHPFQSISAASALAKGLKPARIDCLTKRQWNALSKGLELRREDRSLTIKELMDGLTLKPQLPIYRTISIISLSLVAWFVYNQYFGPNELSRVINETLAKATQCFETKDFQCAIESANAILEISPDHQQAIELGHQAIVNQLIANVENCNADTELVDCENEDFRQLRKLIPDSPILIKLLRRINQKKLTNEIDTTLQVANSCFDAGDFNCAILKAEQVIILSPQNAEAVQLKTIAVTALGEQELAEQISNKSFESAFTLAKRCFARKDFACALKQAKAALTFKPNDPAAEELKQNALYSNKQQQENLTKANKVLQDGYFCLKKLDYSCAIAKSESALDFVPGHIKALQLKKDATKSLNLVKKNIEIE